MNIFYLHNDPKVCAELHVDKHVVKMIVEYAQLLSTAKRMTDGIKYEAKSRFHAIKHNTRGASGSLAQRFKGAKRNFITHLE